MVWFSAREAGIEQTDLLQDNGNIYLIICLVQGGNFPSSAYGVFQLRQIMGVNFQQWSP